MNVTATLFGQILAFAVLVWFVMKFLWGPIIQIMEDRKGRIADGLAAAERGHHEREAGEQMALEVIREAREAAAEIMTQAQTRALEIISEAQTEARTEGERLLAAARTEIEREVNQAKEQLRQQVAALAVAGAERILRKEISLEQHDHLLTQLAANL